MMILAEVVFWPTDVIDMHLVVVAPSSQIISMSFDPAYLLTVIFREGSTVPHGPSVEAFQGLVF